MATLFGVASLVAFGEKRVGVAQVIEPFRCIVLNRQIGQRSARDQGQGDGDLRDAWLVQGFWISSPTSRPLLFLGLLAQAGTINVKPLLTHSSSPLCLVMYCMTWASSICCCL